MSSALDKMVPVFTGSNWQQWHTVELLITHNVGWYLLVMQLKNYVLQCGCDILCWRKLDYGDPSDAVNKMDLIETQR